MSLLDLAATVLRAPASLVTDDPDVLLARAPSLLALTAGGSAVWAVAIGTYRGGLQLLYAPLKAPLLLLIPLAVCLPVMRVLFDARGDRLEAATVGSAGLVGMARAALFASAISPMLWLWLSLEPGYHAAVVGMAASLMLAGMPGLWTIAATLQGPQRAWTARIVSLALLGMVTAQTGWVLRPFIARPTVPVAFLRPMASDVGTSLLSSGIQAVGGDATYHSAPVGVLGRGVQGEEE